MADVIGPVPLLNHYKYDLLRRRMLAVITGGLNIRRAPWLLHFIQIVLWVSPFLLSVPFVVVDALKLWNQYYTALVYAIVMAMFSLTLELCVVVWRHCKGGVFTSSQYGDEQDDAIEFDSLLDRTSLDFIFSSKRILSLILTPLVTGLLSYAVCYPLLPSVLLESLPVAGVVVVFILGWTTGCIALYALCARAPTEIAVYRATDPLELKFITRPLYVISLTAFYIALRALITHPAVYLIVLYSLLCVLPLAWTVGVLPPLEALMSWGLEQAHTRLLGGSPAATDLRLLVQFVLSTIAVVIVSVLPTTRYSVLLSTACGFTLSHNLPHTLYLLLCAVCPTKRLKWTSTKLFISFIGIDCHRLKMLKPSILYWFISCLRAGLLLGAALVIVYVTSTVTDTIGTGNIIGGVLLAVYLLLRASDGLQSVYICGLVRNPLHPWTCDNPVKFKTKRRLLQYFAAPRAIALYYLVPLLLVAYAGLGVVSELSLGPTVWAWIAISRLLRLVWQNTSVAHRDLSLIALLHFIVPHLDSSLSIGPATQALVLGEAMNILSDFIHKLLFSMTLFISFIADKKQRTYKCLTVLIMAGTLSLLPIVLTLILLSSILSAPILPLFTLPIFSLSFPRPKRFWPALFNYGHEYTKCEDSVYYQQCTDEIAMAIHRSMSSGAVSCQPGSQLLVRFQDRFIFCSILETGYGFKTLALKGLELQETSCHTTEASKIDEIFETLYNPSTIGYCKFAFNTQYLNTLQPRDSAVIKTYSDAKNVLTGIIDQSSSLKRFSANLLQALTWVLSYHYQHCTCVTPPAPHDVPPPVYDDTDDWASSVEAIPPSAGPMTAVPLGDNESWAESVSSVEAIPPSMAMLPLGPTSSLIPEDCPTTQGGRIEDIFVSPSHIVIPSLPMSRSTSVPTNRGQRDAKVQPLMDTVIPQGWSNVPLSTVYVNKLLREFPTEWYNFIKSLSDGIVLSSSEERQLMTLVMVCYSLVDVPTLSTGCGNQRETTSFDVYQGFMGEFPYSLHLSWLTTDSDLTSLVLKAYRYAVKLLYDEASLGEMDSHTELAEALGEFDSDCFIAPQTEGGWEEAVLTQVPRLFSIARDQENTVYTARVLTLQEQVVHIGQLNSVGVASVWADLSLELLYLTNDDDERYSIQAHPEILRNLTIQAAAPPLGYSVHASGLLNLPTVA